jgi:hypothetical protein
MTDYRWPEDQPLPPQGYCSACRRPLQRIGVPCPENRPGCAVFHFRYAKACAVCPPTSRVSDRVQRIMALAPLTISQFSDMLIRDGMVEG